MREIASPTKSTYGVPPRPVPQRMGTCDTISGNSSYSGAARLASTDGMPVGAERRRRTEALEQAEDAVGPYNVYNIYDDCPLADSWHASHPHVSQRAVRAFHRGRMHLSRLELDAAFEAAFDGVTGGYPWDCSSDRALDGYFTRADVQAALHLKGPGSGFKCGAAHESDLTPSPRRLRKHPTACASTQRTIDSRAGTSKAVPRRSSSGRTSSSICGY